MLTVMIKCAERLLEQPPHVLTHEPVTEVCMPADQSTSLCVDFASPHGDIKQSTAKPKRPLSKRRWEESPRGRAYAVWRGMMKRCYSKSSNRYKEYGARGIKVCDRWHDFDAFFADMGGRPDGMSIDRVDNDNGYSPDNCRWATIREQTRNRRSNIIIEHDGLRMCLQDWAVRVGMPHARVRARIKLGWTPEQALGFEPRVREATLLKSRRKEEAIALSKQGLTYRQIAEKIGVNNSVVCRYLNEKPI